MIIHKTIYKFAQKVFSVKLRVLRVSVVSSYAVSP